MKTHTKKLYEVQGLIEDLDLTNVRVRGVDTAPQLVGRLPDGTGFSVVWLNSSNRYRISWPWPKVGRQKTIYMTKPATVAEVIRNLTETDHKRPAGVLRA